jgi:ribosomal protein S11
MANGNGTMGRLKTLLYAGVLLVGIAGNYALTGARVQQNERDIRKLEETKASRDLTTEQLRAINERLQRMEAKIDRIEDRITPVTSPTERGPERRRN